MHAFGDYNDPEYYTIEDGCAVIDYGFLAGAYEDIAENLGGDYQAEAFLKFTEENDHGIFVGDGCTIEF